MRRPFTMKARLRSFVYAGRGLRHLLVEQHNARIHLAATALVVVAGWYFVLNPIEWALVVLAIGLVWMGEGVNTALEYLADAAVPERHPLVEKAKDVGAASVLVSALTAAVVGALVFLPHMV